MAFIAPLLAIAGTATSAIGQIKSGDAAKNAADINATRSIEDARIKEAQSRRAGAITQGRGRAIVGASGVELTGSPLDVLAENARQDEMDALIIRRNAETEAQAQRMAGAQAKTASRIGAASTILTGGATIGRQLVTLGQTKRKPIVNPKGGPTYGDTYSDGVQVA